MSFFESWVYPNNPPTTCETLFHCDRKLVIVGVIGRSAFPDCNKMSGLIVLDSHPSHLNQECYEGQIRFYYSKLEDVLFLHFQTTYDEYCMRKVLAKKMGNSQSGQHLNFNQYVRNRFAKMLLFATQVCHIVVFVELSIAFDSSMISILKSLKVIRETHVLKFLPKLLKNSSASACLGKGSRICSPRCLFFFENYPDGYDKTEDSISRLEFEIEDNIYKMFRNEFIIPNKSGTPLFSLPGNKRFVYFNTDEKIREDPLLKTLTELQLSFENNNYLKDDTISNMEEQRVFGNFGIPLVQNADAQIEVTPKRNNFMQFLKDHVKEALQFGFDDGVSKFKTISLVPNVRMWYETFKLFHNIFIENPDNPDYEPADPAYKSFLENFDKLMDIDEGFFFKCCENGVKKACNVYSNPILSHYGNTFQKVLIDDALSVFSAHARGPNVDKSGQKLIQNFEQCLIKESQCESLGIRARNSVVAKQNSSKQILISSSNCRRIQCSREDLYVMRQQNYEFYQILPDVCVFCVKNKKYELLN